MTDVDSTADALAAELAQHRPAVIRQYPMRCRCKTEYTSWHQHLADVVRGVLRPVISTADQLKALPHRALVVRRYTSAAGWNLHEVWERRNETWYCLAAPLSPPSQKVGVPNLPVELVWQP